jgi:hypothetical protein
LRQAQQLGRAQRPADTEQRGNLLRLAIKAGTVVFNEVPVADEAELNAAAGVERIVAQLFQDESPPEAERDMDALPEDRTYFAIGTDFAGEPFAAVGNMKKATAEVESAGATAGPLNMMPLQYVLGVFRKNAEDAEIDPPKFLTPQAGTAELKGFWKRSTSISGLRVRSIRRSSRRRKPRRRRRRR